MESSGADRPEHTGALGARCAGQVAGQAQKALARQPGKGGSLHLLRGQAARSGKTPARSPREKYLWKRIADNQIRAYQTELEWIRQTRQDLRDRRYGE